MKLVTSLLVSIGIVLFLILGIDAIYVTLIADNEVLSKYPWGTENGWAYQSKYYYLVSGLLWPIFFWLLAGSVMLVKHLINRSSKDAKKTRAS